MCDLDVYNFLYENNLQEYQAASKKTLHVSDFIMVPPSISNQVSTESRSPQPEVSTSNSDDDAPLRVPNQDSVLAWVDNSAPSHDEFPLKDSLHHSTETENVIPSHGSSPHVDSAFGRSNILSAEKMPEAALQSHTRLDEATALAIKEKHMIQDLENLRKQKKSLLSVAGNPKGVHPSVNIPSGATSTSCQPIAP
jgi:hypothetical protein